MKYYAKTYYKNGQKVGETIQEHTENLLDGITLLRTHFQTEIEQLAGSKVWQDLRIACLLHDLGKLSTTFQNKIRKALKKDPLSSDLTTVCDDVPHNYLSPAFLSGIPDLATEQSRERSQILLYAIAFHHDRPLDFDESTLNEVTKDISTRASQLYQWIKSHIDAYNISELKAFHYFQLKAYLDGNRAEINQLKSNQYFILVKGLLHRLDHAASAHLPVEKSRLGDPLPKLESYLRKNNFQLRPFQRDAAQYRLKNVILTASTGIGKTEFAINWLGDSKVFYTLPLRVSVNAMYKRLSNVFPEDVGIIHSDTYSLCYDDDQLSFENSVQRVDIARQFAYPLIVTTADQLFTSVFKWPGYEKIYATLMYSKVILDEPQSYSPKTLAMIVKALEELAGCGCKFCYMSATQHPFIVKKLSNISTTIGPYYHGERKHKLGLREESISALSSEIVARYKSGDRVLVIVNTVKESQKLFGKLKNNVANIHLLHSGFIKMHRDVKEQLIQDHDKKKKPVVWITTQIVEASLDIDYDVLFTEIATLDALVQRMGRVFRRPGRIVKPNDAYNIMIACSEPSDRGWIYDREIVQLTKHALSSFQGKIVGESDKQALIDQVFDERRLRNTRFFKEFNAAYDLLKLGYQASNRSEAQRLFREIHQVSAIPESIYSSHEGRIDQLVKTIQSKTDRLEKIRASVALQQFLVSVPGYKNKGSFELFTRRSQSIYVVPAKYCEELGLQYDEIEYMY